MLMQVNAFCNTHYQTDYTLHSASKARWIWRQSTEANLCVGIIILEVSLRLSFFNLWLFRALQQQEVNNFSSSDGESVQSYTANYWPGMHTTAPLVLYVNAGFFKDAKEKTSIFSRAALI